MGAPAVRGLNHVTLAVADLVRATAFYVEVLGMAARAHWPEGVYLTAGDLWLCLSLDPEAAMGRPHPDYTHLAFDVAEDRYAALAARIEAVAPLWRQNRSEGLSLYFLDPDGHRLEIHVGSLATRLAHYRAHPRQDRVVHD